MATRTKPTLTSLEREVRLLRSFLIGMVGKDPEGEYRVEFVRKVLRGLSDRPKYTFKDPRSFLAQLRSRA